MKCGRCAGRGWGEGTDGWPVACYVCHGRGSISRRELARRLGVDPKTVKAIDELRARPSTCERVIGTLSFLT